MKKLILIITSIGLSFSVFSQLPDQSLSKNNLKSSVKQVKSNIYYYRSSQEAYVLSSKDKKTFSKDGMLVNHYSVMSILKSDYEYNYEYKGGKIDRYISKTIDAKSKKISSERITDYVYKSGKLTETQYRGVDPTTIKYEYNKDNQLIKESKVGLGGKMIYEKEYEYTAVNNYSVTSYYYSKGIKSEKGDVYKYENGRLVATIFNSYGAPSKSTFSYNDNGDKISYYYKGKLKTEYIYKYDKHNNWIVKIDKTFDTYKKDYSYTYTFREITYKKGSTGSVKLDKDLLKKYEKRNSYDVKPYISAVSKYSQILINPSKVNEMYVLKTQGTKFKVKTDSGNYLTNHVTAVKHTNGIDMIVYHPKSNTTALVKDFNDDLFKRDFWHKAEIISSTDSVFWTINEKGNWYIINKGMGYDKYSETKLKYSGDNPDDVIVYVNDVATYKMKNYKNAIHHKLYPLIKI